MAAEIVFEPSGRHVQLQAGESLLEAARRSGVGITAICGGAGKCGKCRVRLEAGAAVPPTETEKASLRPAELEAGCRLACCQRPTSDMTVFIPVGSRAGDGVVLTEGQVARWTLQPDVRIIEAELPEPSLADFRSDAERLVAALQAGDETLTDDLTIAYPVLRTLPQVLRRARWHIEAVVYADREIIAVRKPSGRHLYGVAIDLGTTTLALTLADLTLGTTCGQAAALNEQIRYGDDVVSRVSYAMLHEAGLTELTASIQGQLDELIGSLTEQAGLQREDVFEVVIAGNTVMEHIAFGLDPEPIGKSPFVSTVRAPLSLPAAALGLHIAPAGYVHSLPMEAGFVGADNVAVLLAERPDMAEELTLVIDIGTNGEINLGSRGTGLCSTSCATGPALEGAEISCGMRAAPGAIERVTIDADTFEPHCQVIGGEKPVCICGSGIIDVIAELVRTGIVMDDGSFAKDLTTPRLRENGRRGREYVLVPAAESASGSDIVITQKDVRAVQLAKSALYVGAQLLIRENGGELPRRIILAGAFGNYIDKEKAQYIGLFPECPGAVIESVGNAASAGALAALLDRQLRQAAVRVAGSVTFIEAAAQPDFQKLFFAGSLFKHGRKKGK